MEKQISVNPENIYEKAHASVMCDNPGRDLDSLIMGILRFCFFTLFPFRVVTSRP